MLPYPTAAWLRLSPHRRHPGSGLFRPSPSHHLHTWRGTIRAYRCYIPYSLSRSVPEYSPLRYSLPADRCPSDTGSHHFYKEPSHLNPADSAQRLPLQHPPVFRSPHGTGHMPDFLPAPWTEYYGSPVTACAPPGCRSVHRFWYNH